jgi:hypothetical protein
MANSKSSNTASVGFWMFALFVTALPCIGVIMVVYWAFAGENETRKNYFRAVIAWAVILTLVWIGMVALGLWPEIMKAVQARMQAGK